MPALLLGAGASGLRDPALTAEPGPRRSPAEQNGKLLKGRLLKRPVAAALLPLPWQRPAAPGSVATGAAASLRLRPARAPRPPRSPQALPPSRTLSRRGDSHALSRLLVGLIRWRGRELPPSSPARGSSGHPAARHTRCGAQRRVRWGRRSTMTAGTGSVQLHPLSTHPTAHPGINNLSATASTNRA